jgi:hypothetical protein
MMLIRRGAILATVVLVLMYAPLPVTAASDGSIPPGTTITIQNWQQYKQYMTEGMQTLFAGTYR